MEIISCTPPTTLSTKKFSRSSRATDTFSEEVNQYRSQRVFHFIINSYFPGGLSTPCVELVVCDVSFTRLSILAYPSGRGVQ